MDARKILPPRSSGSRAEHTPCPCNKPDLTASVPSPHHRSHQPASTLPSPQGPGHSIYLLPGGTASPLPSPTEPTPGQREVFSFPLLPVLCSYTYRTCRELIPLAIKQSASTSSCAAPVTPPKAPSFSGYLVTCGTTFHLARPTTDQRRKPTNSNRRAGKSDAENTPRRRDTGVATACDVSRISWEMSRINRGCIKR